jgi:hypothetical protein
MAPATDGSPAAPGCRLLLSLAAPLLLSSLLLLPLLPLSNLLADGTTGAGRAVGRSSCLLSSLRVGATTPAVVLLLLLATAPIAAAAAAPSMLLQGEAGSLTLLTGLVLMLLTLL